MKRSMFSTFFLVLTAVILILSISLSVFFFITLRNSKIEARLNLLRQQAENLAYMAEEVYPRLVFNGFDFASMNNQGTKFPLPDLIQTEETDEDTDPSASQSKKSKERSKTDNQNSQYESQESFIVNKIKEISDNYDAYTVVLTADRVGHNKLFLYKTDAWNSEELDATFTEDVLADYFDRMHAGETIAENKAGKDGNVFTVVVPFTSGIANASGFVFIQTSAQTIRATYSHLIPQIVLITFFVIMISMFMAYVLTKKITKPLTRMAATAETMSDGNFNVRVPIEGSSEIQNLASSFNSMADKLGKVERSRRDFVANVSHELRSPVTSIQGFTQGMLDGTIAQADREKYLNIINDETHRLSKLIKNLLSLSRMENEDITLNYSSFDINELIRRVLISRINEIDAKHHEIDIQFANELQFVHADQDVIQQVVINLLDNAIKYTDDGGKITLATEQKENTVLFRVSDNGIGISKEDRPFIFDRFYKADKAHTVGKGTGLGLAICKSIMEKHGQTIRLVDVPVGTAFEITLEAAEIPGGKNENSSTCEDQLDA